MDAGPRPRNPGPRDPRLGPKDPGTQGRHPGTQRPRARAQRRDSGTRRPGPGFQGPMHPHHKPKKRETGDPRAQTKDPGTHGLDTRGPGTQAAPRNPADQRPKAVTHRTQKAQARSQKNRTQGPRDPPTLGPGTGSNHRGIGTRDPQLRHWAGEAGAESISS